MINAYEEELVFLEWLKNECNDGGKFPKFDVMSLELFEGYVRRFCTYKAKGKDVENKIIESFKGKGSSEFSEYYKKCGSYMTKEQRESFKFISERYLSNGSVYKCLIIPLQPDYSEFKKLAKGDYWSELDNLSADYLDIYYVFENYGYSGVKLMTAFKSLDQRFHTKVPCIAIWKDSIDEAKVISIRRLSADDVYDVINEIISFIIESKTLAQIVKGADRKVRQLQGAGSESSIKTVLRTVGQGTLAVISAVLVLSQLLRTLD